MFRQSAPFSVFYKYQYHHTLLIFALCRPENINIHKVVNELNKFLLCVDQKRLIFTNIQKGFSMKLTNFAFSRPEKINFHKFMNEFNQLLL